MSSDTTHRPETREELEARVRALERRCADLEASEKRLRLLTNSSQQSMMVAAPDGAIQYLNDYFLHYTGLQRDDALGMNWTQALHPEDAPEALQIRGAGYEAGRAYEYRSRLRRHDGAWRWHVFRAAPISEDGEVIMWVGTASDVHDFVETERALRLSETRFKLMSDAIPQLIWIALPNGNVEFYNSRWYGYTGLSAEEAKIDGWQKIIHPDDVPATMIAWK